MSKIYQPFCLYKKLFNLFFIENFMDQKKTSKQDGCGENCACMNVDGKEKGECCGKGACAEKNSHEGSTKKHAGDEEFVCCGEGKCLEFVEKNGVCCGGGLCEK